MSSTAPRPVALITGAARRVGRAIALELARGGHDVVIHYRASAQEARQAAGEIRGLGAAAWVVQADLQDPAAPRAIIDQTMAEAGRLDVLVNNASIFEKMALVDFDHRRWHDTLQINLAAPIQLCQHAAPHLAQRRGCIVNLCDINSQLRTSKDYLAYGPSKAGLDYCTRALARMLAPEVRVNGVAPGIAEFPEYYSPELRERLIRQVPLQQAGTPEDMARTVRFLVESRYITGQIINVDGGRSIA